MLVQIRNYITPINEFGKVIIQKITILKSITHTQY